MICYFLVWFFFLWHFEYCRRSPLFFFFFLNVLHLTKYNSNIHMRFYNIIILCCSRLLTWGFLFLEWTKKKTVTNSHMKNVDIESYFIMYCCAIIRQKKKNKKSFAASFIDFMWFSIEFGICFGKCIIITLEPRGGTKSHKIRVKPKNWHKNLAYKICCMKRVTCFGKCAKMKQRTKQDHPWKV